jgi:hypothetical protein
MTLLRGITVAMGDTASNITSHVASAADVMQPQHLLRSDTSQSSFSRILEERDNMSIIDDDTFVSNNDSDLGLRQNLNQLLRSQWHLQNLGMPFEGAHTGLAVYDLNGDGYEDILFAAGRHQIDTAYALINLGPADPSGESLDIRFSEPLTLRTGTFYQVDVSPLSSLEEGYWLVDPVGFVQNCINLQGCWMCTPRGVRSTIPMPPVNCGSSRRSCGKSRAVKIQETAMDSFPWSWEMVLILPSCWWGRVD